MVSPTKAGASQPSQPSKFRIEFTDLAPDNCGVTIIMPSIGMVGTNVMGLSRKLRDHPQTFKEAETSGAYGVRIVVGVYDRWVDAFSVILRALGLSLREVELCGNIPHPRLQEISTAPA